MISSVALKGLPQSVRTVSERLFVGPKQSIFGLSRLKRQGDVTMVVDLCKDRKFIPNFEKYYCKLLGIKHVQIPMTLRNIGSTENGGLERVAQVIRDNPKGKAFIHCRHGKHRSVLGAALFEIREGRITNLAQLNEFLSKHKFYEFGKDRKFIQHTQQQIADKIAQLQKLKEEFIKTFFQK